MDKKSGIRLRHLEQKQDEKMKRDVSPATGGRRKIFERPANYERQY